MKTRNLGIVMDQGADFSLVIGIFGDLGAIDITGYAFKSQMRKTTEIANPVADPVAEFSFEILDQVTNKGQVRWFLSKTDIAEIVASVATPLVNQRLTTPFLFDVKMKDTAGSVSRPIQGIIYLSPEATEEAFS